MESELLIKQINEFDIYFEKSDDPQVFDKNMWVINTLNKEIQKYSSSYFYTKIFVRLSKRGKKNIDWYFRVWIPDRSKISPRDVLDEVALIYNLPKEEFTKGAKTDKNLFPRYAAMWSLKVYSKLTYKEVALFFKGRIENKSWQSVRDAIIIYKEIIATGVIKEVIQNHQRLIAKFERDV